MTTNATEGLTSDDLYGLPDNGQRHELVRGRLLSEPPAGFEHGDLLSEIALQLRAFVKAHTLGRVVGGDVGFILGRDPDTVRAPDVAFVKQDRLPEGRLKKKFFSGPPDLAVEVLSPDDRPGAVTAKVADYLAAGTRIIWLVDPDDRTVTVIRPGAPPRQLAEKDEIDGEDVVPGFRLVVAELFR